MSEKPLPSTPHLTGCPLHPLHPSETPTRKTPVTQASRRPMAGVQNGALPKQALGFLPGTRSSSQEFAGQPPALCSAHSSRRPSGTGDTHLPAPLLLLTLEGNFLGCWKLWQRLGTGLSACRAQQHTPASPTTSWHAVGHGHASQKPRPISPGDGWCPKLSTPTVIFGLAVSKMPVHLDYYFFIIFIYFYFFPSLKWVSNKSPARLPALRRWRGWLFPRGAGSLQEPEIRPPTGAVSVRSWYFFFLFFCSQDFVCARMV